MVFTLYDVHGPYPVGATTFAIPLDEFTNPEDVWDFLTRCFGEPVGEV